MGRRKTPRTLTPEETDLWRAVVKHAEPLKPLHPHRPPPPPENRPEDGAGEAPDPPPIPPIPKPAPKVRQRPAAASHGSTQAEAQRLNQMLRHGQTAGIDKRTAGRFTRGRMSIDGRIDLHGMTQETAHRALCGFLARAYDAGHRCVIVVTGKGMRGEGSGVLRRMVPMWLNEPGLRTRILSFSYAQPRDGGEGALYVLLKRRRG